MTENPLKRKREENEVSTPSHGPPEVLTFTATREQVIHLLMLQEHVVKLDKDTQRKIAGALRCSPDFPSDLDTLHWLVDFMSFRDEDSEDSEDSDME